MTFLQELAKSSNSSWRFSMTASERNCFELFTNSNIKVPAESGKSAIFQNPERQQILLVHADKRCRKDRPGCIDCFFEQGKRVADYIVCKPHAVDVVVELKGTDVMRAV